MQPCWRGDCCTDSEQCTDFPAVDLIQADVLQVGFAVAVCAEVALPSSGLFGAWGSDSYNTLLGSAAALLAGAVVSRYFLDPSCLARTFKALEGRNWGVVCSAAFMAEKKLFSQAQSTLCFAV